MSLLDDLPLGRHDHEDEDPLEIRSPGPINAQPLVNSSPEESYGGIDIGGGRTLSIYAPHREELARSLKKPVDLIESPYGDPAYPESTFEPYGGMDPMAQHYKDIQSYQSDITTADKRAKEYGNLAAAKKGLLSDFEGGLMKKHWDSMFHDPHGMQEVPTLKRKTGVSPQEWFKELDEHVNYSFGEDSPNHKKLKQLKQRYSSLYNDWERADSVYKQSKAKHDSMFESLVSLPENIRTAAESWEEEKPEKPLTDKALSELLNNTKFERPRYSPYGDLLNPERVDPREKLQSQGVDPYTGGPLNKADMNRHKKRIGEIRKHGAKALDQNFSEQKLSQNLKKHGWLYSQLGEVAGRSMFLTNNERNLLNLKEASEEGYIKYIHGQPVDQVLEAMGGEKAARAAQIIDNVGKAHAQFERVQLAYVKNWKEKGYEEASEIFDLERKKWQATLQVAKEYGLTNRVAVQGKSRSYLNNIVDEFEGGLMDEDATEIVPGLMGMPGFELALSDIKEFINIRQAIEDHPQSEILKKFHSTPSKTWTEGAKKFIVNPEAIPLMAARVISSYGNTFIDNAVWTVGAGVGAGFLTGGPAGAKRGGALALKANIGITSGVMEYAQTFTEEMEKKGIDWQNPDVFMAALSNPELTNELRENPTLRALAVGLVDQGYASIAGRTARLVKNPAAVKKLPNGLTAFKAELDQGVQASVRRHILSGFAEIGVGTAAGMSGEALAQYLTDGGITDIDSVLAEGVLEMAGPGGWSWAINSLKESITGDVSFEDLTQAEARVLGDPTRDEFGIIENVDQNGWPYQRRRFDNANKLITYLEQEGMLDTSTVEGFMFARMMGFAGTIPGMIQKVGVVISDRTPLSEKNTRGGYHKGVIFLNRKAFEGREDSASHVTLHEGGHFIQDFMMGPGEALAIWNDVLPDEESKKLSYAHYLLGRRVTSLAELTPDELSFVNRKFNEPGAQDTMVAEWITQQMALALASISGITTTAEKLNPDIKKKVQTLLDKVVIGNDPMVNEFFPPELGGAQEQAAMALLKAIGFNPATLENNRRRAAEGPSGRPSMQNPLLVDLTGIQNFTPEQKQLVADLAGFKNWDAIPQAWKDEAIEIWGGTRAEAPTTVDESGQVSMDFDTPTQLPAPVDLSDPKTQARIAELAPEEQRPKAAETQEEGRGLDAPVASPEKKPLSSPIGEALDKVTQARPKDDPEYSPELLEKLKPEQQKIEESQKEIAEKSKAKKEEAEQGKDIKIDKPPLGEGKEPAPGMEWREDEDGKPVLVKKETADKKDQAEKQEVEKEAAKARKEKVEEPRVFKSEEGFTERWQPEGKKETEAKAKTSASTDALEESRQKKPTDPTALVEPRKEEDMAPVREDIDAEAPETAEKPVRELVTMEVGKREPRDFPADGGEPRIPGRTLTAQVVKGQEENVRKHLVDPYDNEKEAEAALKQRENIAEDWAEFDDQMVVAQDRLKADGQPITEINLLIKMLDIDADVTKPFDELFAGSDKLSKTFKHLTSGQLNQENTDEAINELTKALEDAFPAFQNAEEIVRNVLIPFGTVGITSSEMNQISGTVDPESGVFFREGRTRENASSTDATIAIATDFTTAGEKSTKRYVEKAEKKYIPIDISGEQAAGKKPKKHAMAFSMEASKNIWGEKTNTLAEVESGRRTATTRSFALGEVGDIVTFEKSPTQYRITKVEKLTAENTKDESWIKDWSKAEGWTVEHFKGLLGDPNKKTVKVGSFQTHFEKVADTQDAGTQAVGRKTYGDKVTTLNDNQVFVFGSNPEGRHGAGAAKQATKWGAEYGNGEGPQGQTYAIPTKDLRVKENRGFRSISAKDITTSISKFYGHAKKNPEKEFLVSDYSGNNLNGYTGQEMADMFNDAGPIPDNVIFSDAFQELLTGKQVAGPAGPTGHARKSDNGFEISTKANTALGKSFSALNAKLSDGQTIEHHYQVNVKGYPPPAKVGDRFPGKGKPPKDTSIDSYAEYKKLWDQYARENPEKMEELREASKGKVLTDVFATTEVSQARALYEILDKGAPEAEAKPDAGPAPKLLESDPKLSVEHFKDDQIKATLADGTEGTPTVKGLSRHTGVFTEKETETITKEIDWLKANPRKLHNSEWTYNKTDKRTQINFGYYYSYGFEQFIGGKRVKKPKGLLKPEDVEVEPMPSWMEEISDRLIKEGVITEADRPDSALINLYPPEKGAIPPHVDHANFDRPVITIRFKNPVDMDFGYKTGFKDKKTGKFRSSYSRENAEQQKSNVDPFSVGLGVGEVHVMSGEAANNTTHAIFQDSLPDDGWSYSITLRQVKTDLNISENTAQGYESKKAADTQAADTQAAELEVTNEMVEKVVADLNSVKAESINIAGNGAYSLKGQYTQEQVDEFTYELLRRVTQSPTLNNKIKSINSGGQTGLDEAGTKAGIRLDIPTTIIAPKGWMFKTEDGSTVTDEKAFKDRFKGVEVEEQTLQPVTGPKGQMGFHKKKKKKEKEKATEEGTKTITLDSQIGERGDLVNFTTGFDNEHEKPEGAYAYEIVSVKTTLDDSVGIKQLAKEQSSKRDVILEAEAILQEIKDLEKIDAEGPDISADPNHPVFKQFHESVKGSIEGARALLNAELQEIRNVPTSKEDKVAALKKIKVKDSVLKTYLKERPAEIAKDLRILSNLEKPSFMQEGYVEAEDARERKKIISTLKGQRNHLLDIVERLDKLRRPFQEPPTFTYTLRAVTTDEAKRDLNWLDLPIASLPSAERGGEYFNPFTDPYMWDTGAKKPFYKPQKGKFTPRGQYYTIRDALGKATRVEIRNVDPEIMKNPGIKPEDKAAAREETKAFPVREALRMIDRKEGKGRNGMLHTASATRTKPTPYSIPFKQGHRIMSLMLSIVEQTDQNTHASIADAQRRITELQEKKSGELSDITDYSNVRVATDADGNPASRTPLHAMLVRIRRQTALNQRKDKKGGRAVNYDTPQFGENINDMLIPLIAGATELYGRSYNEMALFLLNEYREGRVSTSEPNILALEKRKTSITPNEIDIRIEIGRDKIKLLRKRLADTPGDKQTIRQLKDIVTAEKEARALLKELESEKGKRLNPYEWLEDTGYDVFQLSKPEPDTASIQRKRRNIKKYGMGWAKITGTESGGFEFVGKPPSQKHIDEIWDHVAALTAMTSGEAPGNVGDVISEMRKGESWVTKSVDRIESWTGIEPVPDSDIDKQVEPGSWQDKWLNGVGKDYDYVKAVYEFLKSNNQDIKKIARTTNIRQAKWWPSYENLAKEATRLGDKARKAEALLANREAAFKKLGKEAQKKNKGKLSHYRKQATGSRKLADRASDEAMKALNEGDPDLVAFPEIQLLEVPTSTIQDTRFANWAWLSPVVMGNFTEKNTLKHLFSIPKKNKAGNITQGGLAGGWIVQTGFLKTAIDHYGELTKNEPQAMDHGLTYADLVKQAKARFENNLKLIDEKVKEAEANDESPGAIKRLKALKDVFLNLHGDPNLTADIDGKSEEGKKRKSVAWRGFMVAYFAHKIQRLTGHAGGIAASQQGTLGTFEASAGETTTDKSDPTGDKGDDAEGGDVLTGEDGGEVSVQGVDVNDLTKGEGIAELQDPRGVDIMEDLEVDDTGVKSVKKSDKARFQKLAKMTATEIKNSDDPLISWAMGQNLTPAEFKKILKLAMSPQQFTGPEAEKIIPNPDTRQRLQVAMSKRSEGIALGSELGLTTDVEIIVDKRTVLAARVAAMGGYKKLDKEDKVKVDGFWRSSLGYWLRKGFSNQHQALEDKSMDLIQKIYGKEMTKGRDFFDFMGILLPTFAKTKVASQIFLSEYRKPLVAALEKRGISNTQSGKLYQSLNAFAFNTKIRRKLSGSRDEANEIIAKARTVRDNALKKAKKEDVADIEATFKKVEKEQQEVLKEFSEENYHNEKGEFAPSGISNKEAIANINAFRKVETNKGVFGEKEKEDILGLWARMNGRTIEVQWETGQITFEEAVTLIASASVARDAKSLRSIVGKALNILDDKGKLIEDALEEEDLAAWKDSESIFENTVNTKEYKEMIAELDALPESEYIPDGYYYAPMRGFEDNPTQYSEQETIDELLHSGPGIGAKGWSANKSNKVSKNAKGRKKGVDRPDPQSALAHAFLAHDEAVMRGTRQTPGRRMREWYELFLAMYENQTAIENGEKVEWSEDTLEVLKENGLEGAFKDSDKLKFLWEEFNGLFAHTTETDVFGEAPTESEVRVERRTITDKDGNSYSRAILRRGDHPVNPDNKLVLITKVKGKLQFVKFKDTTVGARFINELKNLDGFVLPKQMAAPFTVVNTITRFMANMYTSWSPEFIFTNAIKDAIGSIFNITEDGKKKVLKSIGNDMKSYGKIAKAIYTVERDLTEGKRSKKYAKMTKEDALNGPNKIADDDWAGWFQFFEAHGMRTAFTAPEQIADLIKQMERELNGISVNTYPDIFNSDMSRADKLHAAKMRWAESKIPTMVSNMNTAVENVMRVVTAKNLLANPATNFTLQQAVMAGRNVTVDFNRKGVYSSLMGGLFVFFNAGAQGTVRFYRSLMKRDDAMKWAVSIIGLSTIHGVVSRMLTIRDDDDDEEGPGNAYDDHPEFRKNTNAIFHFAGDERHMKIPLPWGPNLLWMLGQKIANVISGNMGLSKTNTGIVENSRDALEDIYSTVNPLGGNPLQGPTFMAPVVAVNSNENFWGGTISKEDPQFAKTKTPAAYMHKDSTRSAFVKLSQAINSAMGGDEVTPGSLKRMIDPTHIGNEEDDFMTFGLSGSDLEHLFDAYSGGLGKNLTQIVSGGASMFYDKEIDGWEDVNWNQIPLLSRLGGDEPTRSGVYFEFKRLKEIVYHAEKALTEHKGSMSPEAYRAMQKAHNPKLGLARQIDNFDKKRKKQQKMLQKIEASTGLSNAQKHDMVEKLEKQRVVDMRKILQNAVKLDIDV